VAGEASGVSEQRADVVDLDTAFDQQFLDVTAGQVEAQVPTNRDHDHLGREPDPPNADRGGSARRGRAGTFTPVKPASIMPAATVTEPEGKASARWRSLI
jgi:hypothetical protein